MDDRRKASALRSRFRFVFARRHLLGSLAVALVAALITFTAVAVYHAVLRARAVARLQEHGFRVVYEVTDADATFHSFGPLPAGEDDHTKTVGAELLHSVRGVVGPGPAYDRPEVTDTDLQGLEKLRQVEVLSLIGCSISDSTMSRIAKLTDLTHLNLNATHITDVGLREVTGLQKLTHLDLGFTSVTNSGLRTVSELPLVEYLNLTGTEITDEGLKHLCRMKRLRALHLDLCEVTADGIARLECLGKLEVLSLINVRLQNEDAEQIGRIKTLRYVYLMRTGITEEQGAKRLRELLPNLQKIQAEPEWKCNLLPAEEIPAEGSGFF